jgi:hypothetical protein
MTYTIAVTGTFSTTDPVANKLLAATLSNTLNGLTYQPAPVWAPPVISQAGGPNYTITITGTLSTLDPAAAKLIAATMSNTLNEMTYQPDPVWNTPVVTQTGG